MDFKISGKSISLQHTLKKGETYKTFNKKNIFSLYIYNKPQTVKGVTSMCEDGKHILCLDYDNICYWIVRKEVEKLSEKYGVMFIFKTKESNVLGEIVGNYHVYCLSKFYPGDIVRIQQETHCDSAYTSMPLRNIYRSWVLRISGKIGSGKPEFKEMIGSPNNHKVSTAHYLFLKEFCEMDHLIFQYQDNFKKLYFNVYETGV